LRSANDGFAAVSLPVKMMGRLPQKFKGNWVGTSPMPTALPAKNVKNVKKVNINSDRLPHGAFLTGQKSLNH
jgi:hypothetical protein